MHHCTDMSRIIKLTVCGDRLASERLGDRLTRERLGEYIGLLERGWVDKHTSKRLRDRLGSERLARLQGEGGTQI